MAYNKDRQVNITQDFVKDCCMNELEKTKRQLSASGPNMPRRQSRRRKPSKKEEQAQKQPVIQPPPKSIEEDVSVPKVEQNVIFSPNKGPQTEFLAAGEKKSCTAVQRVAVSHMPCW